jgi:aspartate aminotransferase
VTPLADFYMTPGLGKTQVRLALVLDAKKLEQAVTLLGKAVAAYRKTSA